MTGAKVIKTQYCRVLEKIKTSRQIILPFITTRHIALLPSGKAQHFDCCIRWFESNKGSYPKWDSKNKHNRKEEENMENREENENKEIKELKNKVEELTKEVADLKEMCKHTFSDVACVMMAADLLLRKNFDAVYEHGGNLLREVKSCLRTINYAKVADSFYMQHALYDNPKKKMMQKSLLSF